MLSKDALGKPGYLPLTKENPRPRAGLVSSPGCEMRPGDFWSPQLCMSLSMSWLLPCRLTVMPGAAGSRETCHPPPATRQSTNIRMAAAFTCWRTSPPHFHPSPFCLSWGEANWRDRAVVLAQSRGLSHPLSWDTGRQDIWLCCAEFKSHLRHYQLWATPSLSCKRRRTLPTLRAVVPTKPNLSL